jgi:putative endonuclease
MPAFLYILRLKSGNLYIGSTLGLEQRLQEHVEGRACYTTCLDPPLTLVYSEKYTTFREARRREDQLKRWTRAKKEALISGDLEILRKLAKSRENKR